MTSSSPVGSPVQITRLLRPFLKIGVFFLTVVAVIIFVRVFDLESILDPAWADHHLRIASDGSLTGYAGSGTLLYIAMVALLSPLGIPRQALSALGGYAFGAFFGAVWASVGLVIGCAGGFFYSRLLARAALQKRLGNRIQRLDTFLSCNPLGMAIAIRCFPIGNNALTTLAAGITSITAWPFIVGSGIGYLPQTIIFALLGSGVRINPVWRTVVSAVLFVAATGLGFLLYKKFKGEQSGLDAQSDKQQSV